MNESLTEIGGVTGALVLFGALLKHVVPSDAINRWIPLILIAVGTPLNIWLTGEVTPVSVITSFVLAAGATGLHQTVKTTTGANV